MITKFKIFENINEDKPKIGDKIICVNNFCASGFLVKNHVYKIEDIKILSVSQYKLVGVECYWYTDRFKSGTSEEIEKFEMEQDSEKYNL